MVVIPNSAPSPQGCEDNEEDKDKEYDADEDCGTDEGVKAKSANNFKSESSSAGLLQHIWNWNVILLACRRQSLIPRHVPSVSGKPNDVTFAT